MKVMKMNLVAMTLAGTLFSADERVPPRAALPLMPLAGATVLSSASVPNFAIEERWCRKCFVLDWIPIAGKYSLEWSAECPINGPYMSAPGQYPPGEGWTCAHCLNESDFCFEHSGEYIWDGPCHVSCCPTTQDPSDDAPCDVSFSLRPDDTKTVLAAIRENPRGFDYDVARDLIRAYNCRGEIIRTAKPSPLVRDELLRTLSSEPVTLWLREIGNVGVVTGEKGTIGTK